MTIVILEVDMKVVKASEFKAKCLKLMDEVAQTGEPIVITKNGKPVSRLVPHCCMPKELYGALKGTVTVSGDIVAPVGDTWEVER